jgi:hypothetical protein
VAGAAGHERDAGLAREPRIRIGHVHRGRFVAHVDEIDAAIDERIEHRHHVVSR